MQLRNVLIRRNLSSVKCNDTNRRASWVDEYNRPYSNAMMHYGFLAAYVVNADKLKRVIASGNKTACLWLRVNDYHAIKHHAYIDTTYSCLGKPLLLPNPKHYNRSDAFIYDFEQALEPWLHCHIIANCNGIYKLD